MSLLPPNSTPFERALETVLNAPQIPNLLHTLWNPDTCPIALLPWLAWSLGVDSWDATWPEHIRRDRVKKAVYVQSIKGTRASIEAIVSVYGAGIFIREWWQKSPMAAPFTFELVLKVNDANGDVLPSSYINQIIDDVVETKPLRSRFVFSQEIASTAQLTIKPVARLAQYQRLTMTA